MTSVSQASLSDLAAELDRAEYALSISWAPSDRRKWSKYRKLVKAELMRRTEPPAGTPPVTDAELMAGLAEFSPAAILGGQWTAEHDSNTRPGGGSYVRPAGFDGGDGIG